MNKAYLLIGGNLGSREQNLAKAREWIQSACGRIKNASSVYETDAWGKTDQPSFLNQALEIETILEAEPLMKEILSIEKKMGRMREEKYGPRMIDIDILLYNNDIINDPFLTIPHPQMQNRRFVLMPLAEIAPDVIHPVMKKSINELLVICSDHLDVRKYP